MKNNSIYNSQYNVPPWATNIYKGYQVSRSTHATLQKLAEQDFHFLFTEEGKKSTVNFLIKHHFNTHMSYRNKTTLLPILKALWLPKINGMQVNRRLSSKQRPVAFNFPSDRKTVCAVSGCVSSVLNLWVGHLGQWFHLLQISICDIH